MAPGETGIEYVYKNILFFIIQKKSQKIELFYLYSTVQDISESAIFAKILLIYYIILFFTGMCISF